MSYGPHTPGPYLGLCKLWGSAGSDGVYVVGRQMVWEDRGDGKREELHTAYSQVNTTTLAG